MGKLRVIAGVVAVATLVSVGLVYATAWAMDKLAEDDEREHESDFSDGADVIDLRGAAYELPGPWGASRNRARA